VVIEKILAHLKEKATSLSSRSCYPGAACLRATHRQARRRERRGFLPVAVKPRTISWPPRGLVFVVACELHIDMGGKGVYSFLCAA